MSPGHANGRQRPGTGYLLCLLKRDEGVVLFLRASAAAALVLLGGACSGPTVDVDELLAATRAEGTAAVTVVSNLGADVGIEQTFEGEFDLRAWMLEVRSGPDGVWYRIGAEQVLGAFAHDGQVAGWATVRPVATVLTGNVPSPMAALAALAGRDLKLHHDGPDASGTATTIISALELLPDRSKDLLDDAEQSAEVERHLAGVDVAVTIATDRRGRLVGLTLSWDRQAMLGWACEGTGGFLDRLLRRSDPSARVSHRFRFHDFGMPVALDAFTEPAGSMGFAVGCVG